MIWTHPLQIDRSPTRTPPPPPCCLNRLALPLSTHTHTHTHTHFSALRVVSRYEILYCGPISSLRLCAERANRSIENKPQKQAVHTQTGQQTYGYVTQVNSAINSKSLHLIPPVVTVVLSAQCLQQHCLLSDIQAFIVLRRAQGSTGL